LNPFNHPAYEHLPLRTRKKLLSPISEDKLTWDCCVGLRQAGALGPVLADALGLSHEKLVEPQLILWGLEIGESSAPAWPPLLPILFELENYRDGKPEGQKTEPDAIVVTNSSIVVLECKRTSDLGECSRFKDQRCPEINLDRRKRPFCQYWARGLDQLVSFPKPEAGASVAPCSLFYQLMRNYMVGFRLAQVLKLGLHLLVVKASNSPHFSETVQRVAAFNSFTRNAPKYSVVSWNDLRFANGKDLLPGYAAELSVDP
jgi:hypothetical protein